MQVTTSAWVCDVTRSQYSNQVAWVWWRHWEMWSLSGRRCNHLLYFAERCWAWWSFSGYWLWRWKEWSVFIESEKLSFVANFNLAQMLNSFNSLKNSFIFYTSFFFVFYLDKIKLPFSKVRFFLRKKTMPFVVAPEHLTIFLRVIEFQMGNGANILSPIILSKPIFLVLLDTNNFDKQKIICS